MYNYQLIELQENDMIPFKIIVNDIQLKFQIPCPFSEKKTSLVKHISDTKKEQLKDEINIYEKCFDFMKNIIAGEDQWNELVKNQETKYFIQNNSDLLIGRHILQQIITGYYNYSKALEQKEKKPKTQNDNSNQEETNKSNQSKTLEQKEIVEKIQNDNPNQEKINKSNQSKTLEQKEIVEKIQNVNPNQEKINKSNVAILIYQGESTADLNNVISYFKALKIIPIILINCEKHFQQLINEENIYQEYMIQYKKYSQSTDHSFFLEKSNGNSIYYFAFFQQLDTMQLIRWIYLGILSFIDPEYVVISKSNFQFNFPMTDLFSLFSQKQSIFGIQWCEKYLINDKNLNQLSYYLQIPQSIINFHSIFKIKQFHNPLQCIYKWSLISNQIQEYYTLLQRSQQNNIGPLELNSILPKLMLTQPEQLELYLLKSPILIKSINELSEATLIDYYIEKRQNIQNQMQYHELITSDWKIYIFVQLQNFFSKFQFISGYFGISICKTIQIKLGFFFAFYCPYQLIYNILEQSSFYTVLAIPIPLCYSLNVLVFTLISILYNSQDKILLRNKFQKIPYILNYIRSKQIVTGECKNTSEFQFQQTCSLRENQLNFQIEIQIDDSTSLLKKSISTNDENKKEYFLEAPIPQIMEVNKIFMGLISIQKILDFAVFLFTFFNVILLYGKHLWDYSVVYQSIIIFLVIIVIFIAWAKNGLNLLAYPFNFSFLSYFWQIQNINSKKYLPHVQLARKRQLAQLLLTNAIVLYFFIAIESYYNYSGYVFLGILGYLCSISISSRIEYYPFHKYSPEQIYLIKIHQSNDDSEKKHQVEVKFRYEDIGTYISIAIKFINKLIEQQLQLKQQTLQQDVDQITRSQNNINMKK